MIYHVQDLNTAIEINKTRTSKKLTTVYSELVDGKLEDSDIVKELIKIDKLRYYGEITPDQYFLTPL